MAANDRTAFEKRFISISPDKCIGANFVPGVRRLLGTQRLSMADWITVLLSAGTPLVINEGVKVALRLAAENQNAGAESSDEEELRTAAE